MTHAPIVHFESNDAIEVNNLRNQLALVIKEFGGIDNILEAKRLLEKAKNTDEKTDSISKCQTGY